EAAGLAMIVDFGCQLHVRQHQRDDLTRHLLVVERVNDLDRPPATILDVFSTGLLLGVGLQLRGHWIFAFSAARRASGRDRPASTADRSRQSWRVKLLGLGRIHRARKACTVAGSSSTWIGNGSEAMSQQAPDASGLGWGVAVGFIGCLQRE